MAFQTRKCPACGEKKKFRTDVKTCGCRGTNPGLSTAAPAKPTADPTEVALEKLRDKRTGKDRLITDLRHRVISLEEQLAAVLSLKEKTPQTYDVLPKIAARNKSESAAVAVWSDWHIEERVTPGQVGNRNEYNLEICDKRFHSLLQGTLAWFNIENAKTNIRTFVLACLGDYISNNIHEDLAEANLLAPVDAIYKAQNMLITGIQFLLDHLPSSVEEIVIVCHGGNHGRTTKEQRIATETGNSLEQYMFYTIRDFFKGEKRLKFQIATGYHSFLRFFEGRYEIRFHHGHAIKYSGGVGEITVPVNKAIAQWNKARTVNLDVFGHYHQKFDGGNFICNGSLIGYNAYAVSIKASYERPSQTFFLVNKEYESKTMVAPIFV